MLGLSALSCRAKESRWSSDSRVGCFKGDATHVQRDCNASNKMCKQMSGRCNQSKSWSMSEPPILGKGKGKENQGKSKVLSRGIKSENKSAKGSCEGKMLKRDKLTMRTRRGFTRN